MRILLAGDVCLASLEPHGMGLDPAMENLLSTADLAIANLECPVTMATTPQRYQSLNLKAPPQQSWVFDHFDVFSLANNHIMDYGKQGLMDTLSFLQAHCRLHTGAGKTARESGVPATVQVGGVCVAVFAVSQWYCAMKGRSGTASDRSRDLRRRIQQARRDGCFVIVMPHWGYEYVDYPSPSQRRFAHLLTRYGAHLVVGCHPHVVNGFEMTQEGSIFYSLGNFLFDSSYNFSPVREDRRFHQSFLLEVKVAADTFQMDFRIHPVWTDETGVRAMGQDEEATFLASLDRLNDGFKSSRELAQCFYSYAPMICQRTKAVLGNMAKRQGIWTIVKRLHRIRRQDLMVRLHAIRNA